jgi:hypothetical protein
MKTEPAGATKKKPTHGKPISASKWTLVKSKQIKSKVSKP